MATQPLLNPADFAAKIKAKYPDYASVPDEELTQRILAKYPEYRDKVSIAPQQPLPKVNMPGGNVSMPDVVTSGGASALRSVLNSKAVGKLDKAVTPILEPIQKVLSKPEVQMGIGAAMGGAPQAEDFAMTAMKQLASAGEKVRAAGPAGKAYDAFRKLSSTVGDKPVAIDTTAKIAAKIQADYPYGNQPVKVIDDFVSRIADTKQPLTYNEARKFYSNATRLTDEELSHLKPTMRRQIINFTKVLGKSIEATTDEAGQLNTYRSAMSNYRLAKRLEGVVKYGKRTAVGLGGLGGAYELYRLLRR